MSDEYYVYLHRRNDTNEVFYVGKGRKFRAGKRTGRSEWWTRVVEKYGYTIEYAEKGMSQESAFDLEMELIKFYRECGHPLVNLTDGGEGNIGYVPPEDVVSRMRADRRQEAKRELMRRKISKPVLCSNGMTFGGAKEAEIWLGNRESSSRVSSCCRRERCHAGGYVWRYLDDCDDLQKCIDEGKNAFVEFGCQDIIDSCKPKRVRCSNGMEFESCSATVKWLHSIGYIKADSSHVSAACLGKKKTIYGLSMCYVSESQISPETEFSEISPTSPNIFEPSSQNHPFPTSSPTQNISGKH